MLLTAGLPKSYWEEAVATSCYLQNRTPHSSDPLHTPYFHWFGQIPNLHHLRVFGCAAYPVQALEMRRKFDATSTRMVFVGYGDRFGVKAYRLYDPQKRKFQLSHSVYFDELALLTPQHDSKDPSLSHTPMPNSQHQHPALSSAPQVAWEESDEVLIPPQVQPQLPQPPRAPTSPVSIQTPLPNQAPPWSLGGKTGSFLFPQSPNPLHNAGRLNSKISIRRGLNQPLQFESSSPPVTITPSLPPQAEHMSPPGSSTIVPASSPAQGKPSTPSAPVEPIHQPSLMGPPPRPRPSMSNKFRSLREIYESSNLSALLGSSIQSESVFGPEKNFANLTVADVFNLQVLHATANGPLDDPGALALNSEQVDEISVDEALSGPEASKWEEAMNSEYQSLMDNKTWQLVPAPADRKLVTCKWLLRKKFHSDGSVSRYKARLVARGFSQVQGMDYRETFSPVLRITTFRILIAIAAQFRFLLHQMDVRTAFLHGDLEEEIYMKQPPGYISGELPNYVCRLLKSLYGLKQSPRQWYQRFHQCMINLGYLRLQSDPNVYSRHATGIFLLLAIYVDDILLLCNSQSALDAAKEELHCSFSMSDMGPLHFYLGIQVHQDSSQGIITISQQSYINSLLKKYNMEACKGMDTPLPATLKLQPVDTVESVQDPDVQVFPYSNILGGVRYLVTCTRFDICFAANLLSRYMQKPGAAQVQYLKRLLRYLQYTKAFGLIYQASTHLPTPFLVGYSDADWGGDQTTLQSTLPPTNTSNKWKERSTRRKLFL